MDKAFSLSYNILWHGRRHSQNMSHWFFKLAMVLLLNYHFLLMELYQQNDKYFFLKIIYSYI